jgi:SynChlorMet cassette protein ScmC
VCVALPPSLWYIVSVLGTAMCPQPGETGRELLVTVSDEGDLAPANLAGPGPALCVLSPPGECDMLTVAMLRLALAIARGAQSRGGLLLHGAFATQTSDGILLAGPGSVGKRTASRRLPPPWRALCDDTSLVIRGPQGSYWAHPWPTWSRFFHQGIDPPPGGSWDVQQAVPLRAIFFLSQAPDDRAEALSVTRCNAARHPHLG